MGGEVGGAIIYESVVGGDWYTLASVSSDDDNLSHKKKEKCQKRKKERERERERLMRKQHQTVGWDYDYVLGGGMVGVVFFVFDSKRIKPSYYYTATQ